MGTSAKDAQSNVSLALKMLRTVLPVFQGGLRHRFVAAVRASLKMILLVIAINAITGVMLVRMTHLNVLPALGTDKMLPVALALKDPLIMV